MIYELLYRFLNTFFQSLYALLMIRVVLSWIPHNPFNVVVRFVYTVTEPILRPFRDLIPTGQIGIDLSPIIAFFVIGFVKRLLFNLLF